MRFLWLAAPLVLYVTGCGLVFEGVEPPRRTDGGADSATGMDSSIVGDAVIPDAAIPDAVAPDAMLPDECAGQDDLAECNAGAPAGERWVCLDQICRVSMCGDGFLDDTTENCDDGNAVPDDGCELDCTYSCENGEDCLDGNPCNGQERCETHACVPGVPRADGDDCRVADTPGICRAGFCAPETCGDGTLDGGEQCDDGNAIAGDGCEPDCTFTCESDADCIGNTCMAGTCDATSYTCGLVPRDTDGDGYTVGGACGGPDCNDRDGSIHPGRTDICNMIDDDCDADIDEDDRPIACWTDADGDGHSDLPLRFFCLPMCPGGFVPRPISDCYDSATDPLAIDAHPGQMGYFTMPFFPSPGSPSFDYNCDGLGEQQYPMLADCRPAAFDCGTGSGFTDPVPACGDPGDFVFCGGTAGACTMATSRQPQPCH